MILSSFRLGLGSSYRVNDKLHAIPLKLNNEYKLIFWRYISFCFVFHYLMVKKDSRKGDMKNFTILYEEICVKDFILISFIYHNLALSSHVLKC